MPLMTLRFLTWRGTLYSSVCYCYQDLKQLQSAEVVSHIAWPCFKIIHKFDYKFLHLIILGVCEAWTTEGSPAR